MVNASSIRAENVQVARLQRELNDVSRPRRDPARHHGNQQVSCTFAGDVRLIASH